MIETKPNVSIKQSSEKSFAFVFFVFFLLIALYPLINKEPIYLWALITSFIILFLGLFFPNCLSLPNKLWFKFGILLGYIISPIVLTIIYILAVCTTSVFVRLLGKDLLKMKIDKNSKTYWIKREEKLGTMKNQF